MRAKFSWAGRSEKSGDTLFSRSIMLCEERLYVDLDRERHEDEYNPIRAIELHSRGLLPACTWPGHAMSGGGAVVQLRAHSLSPFSVRARVLHTDGTTSAAAGEVRIVPRASRCLAVALSLCCVLLLIWTVWVANSISWASPTARLFAGAATVLAVALPLFISALNLSGLVEARAFTDWRVPGAALCILATCLLLTRQRTVWIANSTPRTVPLGTLSLPPHSNLLLLQPVETSPPSPVCQVPAPGSPMRNCQSSTDSSGALFYSIAAAHQVRYGCPQGSREDCCTPAKGRLERGESEVRWRLPDTECRVAVPRLARGGGKMYSQVHLRGPSAQVELKLQRVGSFDEYTVTCNQSGRKKSSCTAPLPKSGESTMLSFEVTNAGRTVGTLHCRQGSRTVIAGLTAKQGGLQRLIYRDQEGQIQSDWQAHTPEHGDPALFCDNGAGAEQRNEEHSKLLQIWLTRKGVDLSRWELEFPEQSPFTAQGSGVLEVQLVRDEVSLGSAKCSGSTLAGAFGITDFALRKPAKASVVLRSTSKPEEWALNWKAGAEPELELGWGCFPRDWNADVAKVLQPANHLIQPGSDRHPIATVHEQRAASYACTRYRDGRWSKERCRQHCISIRNWDEPPGYNCDAVRSWECTALDPGVCAREP